LRTPRPPAEPPPASKTPALPNLADAGKSPRPQEAGGGSGTARAVRLPSLTFRKEDLQHLAADVYDASFLEGFVRGYDATRRGRAVKCCSGSTKKSLLRVSRAGTGHWLEYFSDLRDGQPLRPGASPRVAESPLGRRGRRLSTGSSYGSPREEGEGGDAGRGRRAGDSPSRSPRSRHSSKRASSAAPLADRSAEASPQDTQRQQREACESLRVLLFGHVGNEDWLIQDRQRIFELQRGTEAEIETFVEQWMLLDEDDSGTIDFSEFLDFFAKKKADKILGMRCVRYLVGRTGEHHVDRSDLIRLLWLQASEEDVRAMEALFDLKKLARAAVEPPPLLPRRRRRELLENFRDLDNEGKGLVPYTELVLNGLADEDMMKELREKYDKDGNGTLDFEEFLEMLCPYGFRAHEEVKVAITKEGDAMRFATCMCGENRFSGWFMEPDFLALKNIYGFEE